MTRPTVQSDPPAASYPVFVFGVPHSGTTVLYAMLAYHPRLTWFSQFSLRGGQIPGRSRRPGADRLDTVLRTIRHDWQKGRQRFKRFMVPRPREEPAIWDHLLEDPTTDVARMRSCLMAFGERHGGRRVLAKWPTFGWYLDRLRASFPSASFVHIVRDGRPVALSLRSKDLAMRSKGLPTAAATEDPDCALRWAARHWVEGLELVDETPGIDLLEVRYEDLCENVHGVLHAILRHARLDIESFPFHRCPRTLSNRNSRWIEEASSAELKQVSGIQRDLLVRYGYRPELVSPRPGTPRAARNG